MIAGYRGDPRAHLDAAPVYGALPSPRSKRLHLPQTRLSVYYVLARLDDPLSSRSLRRFANLLTGFSTLLLLIFVTTPLANWWLQDITALDPALVRLAGNGLWIGLLLPGLTTFQSCYQGVILNNRKTRAIPEAVFVFLIITSAVLAIGVFWQKIIGLYVSLGAIVLGSLIQTFWLWYRSRSVVENLYQRDAFIDLN